MGQGRIPQSARQRREREQFWEQVPTWQELSRALIWLLALVGCAAILYWVCQFISITVWPYTGVVE